MRKQVLIVEDDISLGESLSKYLEKEDYRVIWVQDLESATEALGESDIDLVVLDWRLPDGEGIGWLREQRSKQYLKPIIMLTSRSDLIDKILGLETGADDYITKPFEPREFLARVRVQLREQEVDSKGSVVSIGKLKVDPISRQATYNNIKIPMTKMEYELIYLLARDPNKVFSREEILNKVWGYETYPSTRTVDTHILQLRQKLDGIPIETVRGIGYRLQNN